MPSFSLASMLISIIHSTAEADASIIHLAGICSLLFEMLTLRNNKEVINAFKHHSGNGSVHIKKDKYNQKVVMTIWQLTNIDSSQFMVWTSFATATPLSCLGSIKCYLKPLFSITSVNSVAAAFEYNNVENKKLNLVVALLVNGFNKDISFKKWFKRCLWFC